MISIFRRFLTKYTSGHYVHAGIIALIDTVVSVVSTLIAILCTNAVIAYSISARYSLYILLISLAATLVAIMAMKTHKVIIRHSTLADIWRLCVVVIIKELILYIAMVLPFSIKNSASAIAIVADALIFFCGMVGIRILMIVVYEALKQVMIANGRRKNIFIYGTNDKSTALRARLLNSPHYKVIGFLQPGNAISGNKISGLTVYGFSDKENVKRLIKRKQIGGVLFPTYETAKEEQDRLIKYCIDLKTQVLISPSIEEVVDGRIMESAVREIRIEDLLGRDEINISLDSIKAILDGKTILVTGAAGSIGSELCRQLASFDIDSLVMFDNAETPMHNIRLELEERFNGKRIIPVIGDVRQKERLDFVFRTYHPQVIFHAAAYKHVPLMEENPCESILVNVYGTRNLADTCLKYNAEIMVMISTDKAVNPTNIMGCSKRLAEIYTQSLGTAISEGKIKGKTKFVTTRFGNVLGSNGSVIPRFREQIMHGGPVTVTHPDITRFFMTIPEACRLVMEAATMSVGNQIFVFDMGASVKIVDLAKRMIELAGFEVDKDIKIEFTGLRPGEKLYEEVLNNEENTSETTHEKIRIAHVRSYDYDKISEAVDKLHEMAINVDVMNMVRMMKEIVPEFKSRNSRFEALDK